MLRVLFQDSNFVAVDKPSGLLVHRSAMARGETVSALALLRDQLGQWVYPVHRLDRATSGVLLFALSSEAARALSESFRNNTVQKTYFAVVRGHTDLSGEIDRPLRKNPLNKNSPYLESRTSYERVATADVPVAVGKHATARYSIIRVRPLSGRLHQIRRHLCTVSHPLVGDTVYGDGRHNRFFREKFGLQRLLLCAARLEFSHPLSGERVGIRAPSVDGFFQDIAGLNWTFDGAVGLDLNT